MLAHNNPVQNKIKELKSSFSEYSSLNLSPKTQYAAAPSSSRGIAPAPQRVAPATAPSHSGPVPAPQHSAPIPVPAPHPKAPSPVPAAHSGPAPGPAPAVASQSIGIAPGQKQSWPELLNENCAVSSSILILLYSVYDSHFTLMTNHITVWANRVQ